MLKSITEKYWQTPKNSDLLSNLNDLADELNVSSEIVQILFRRGFKNKTDIQDFLHPKLKNLADPFLMKGMKEACKILHNAIVSKKDIVIWGDYDVDGVTSTSLLLHFFKKLDIKPNWFIPNRFKDGYGLNKEILRKICKKCSCDNPVLITVDCGITNIEEIAFAKQLGFSVIITDHHEPGMQGVAGDAVLNVKQPDCNFPDKDLAGVGIAFFLTIGLRSYLKQQGYFLSRDQIPNLKELLEFVAIGTIADMVPLKNSNRLLVKAGFEVLNSCPSIGIASLMKEGSIEYGNITSEDIAFQLAPRINATGRMAEASIAVDLLTTEDKTNIKKLAKKISALNNRRKELCSEYLESTLYYANILKENGDYCIVLKVNCSIGILGIVASQLSEQLRMPVILVSSAEEDGRGKILKGSCRSISGLDLHAVLVQCSSHLLQFGGHRMAAGVTLFEEKFDNFKNAVNSYLSNIINDIPKQQAVVDLEIEIEKALSEQFIKQFQLLEPFGIDNEKPVFIERKSMLQDIKRVGKIGNHLTFQKRGKFSNKKCVAFNYGTFTEVLQNKPESDLIYTLSISRFKNKQQWQANIVDFV